MQEAQTIDKHETAKEQQNFAPLGRVGRIVTWWRNRCDTKEKQLHDSGYNWASGTLLRKEGAPSYIEAYMDLNEIDSFDEGAIEACNYLIALGVIKDDRM